MRQQWRLCELVLLVLISGSPLALTAQLGKISLKPSSNAVPASASLAGTWILTGQYYASGAALPVTAALNVNDTRLTITGENSGTGLVDEPMRYGSGGQIQISCRGTVSFQFTLSHIAGLTVMHETNLVETAGPACRQMAGTKTNQSDLNLVVEIMDGSEMRAINGLLDADRPSKAVDVAIYTWKRARP